MLPASKPAQTSRTEYIPFERRVTEYVEEEIEERVPVQRKVTEFEERRVTEQRPVHKKVTEYYRVEKHTQYVQKEATGEATERVPVRKVVKVPRYLPFESSVVHVARGLAGQHELLDGITSRYRGSQIRFMD